MKQEDRDLLHWLEKWNKENAQPKKEEGILTKGGLYCLERNDLIKIGCTYRFASRLKTLRGKGVKRLLAVYIIEETEGWNNIAYRKERHYHQLLRPYHHQGEWYTPSEKLFSLLKRDNHWLFLESSPCIGQVSLKKGS